MSQKEVERLKTLTRIKSGELTVSNTAESLRLSERHIYRILKRYSDEGDVGIIHRSRGRQSNNRLPQTTYSVGLDAIFCFETKRNVYNDYTIMRNSQYIQLYKSDAPFPPPKSKIIVRRYLDNSLHILWNNNELKYEIFNNKPKQNIVYNSLVKRLLIILGENLTGDSLVIIIMFL
jgi:hypothetical protein